MLLMTADGPQVVTSLRALLETLQRIALNCKIGRGLLPDALATLLT
jgi:hypothetical protein